MELCPRRRSLHEHERRNQGGSYQFRFGVVFRRITNRQVAAQGASAVMPVLVVRVSPAHSDESCVYASEVVVKVHFSTRRAK